MTHGEDICGNAGGVPPRLQGTKGDWGMGILSIREGRDSVEPKLDFARMGRVEDAGPFDRITARRSLALP
jgi:hypothetical protein